MSDIIDEKPVAAEDEKKKRKAEPDSAPRPGDSTEPVPKDEGLFNFLESVFFGPTEYPEKIDCRVVTGPRFEKFGPLIKQQIYPADKKKPTREVLVHFANELTHRMQMDCDVQRKQVVYGIHVWHLSREAEPYERYIKRMVPRGRYNGEPRDEGEEEPTVQERFGAQVLGHGERMFGLYGGGFESLMERAFAIIERQDATIEKKDQRIEKLADIVERALTLEAERNRQAKWDDLKIRSAERVLDTGMNLVPPIVSRFLGPAVMPTQETAETITIKNFLERMRSELLDAVCGKYDAEHKLLERGVLTPEQADILGGVAFCKISADRLNDLMPPNGAHAITMEQIGELQRLGLGLAELAPLQLIFEARQKRGR